MGDHVACDTGLCKRFRSEKSSSCVEQLEAEVADLKKQLAEATQLKALLAEVSDLEKLRTALAQEKKHLLEISELKEDLKELQEKRKTDINDIATAYRMAVSYEKSQGVFDDIEMKFMECEWKFEGSLWHQFLSRVSDIDEELYNDLAPARDNAEDYFKENYEY